MTYGRPSMVTPRTALQRAMSFSPDSPSDAQDGTTDSTTSARTFYSHLLELNEIIGCILVEFYDRSNNYPLEPNSLSKGRNRRSNIVKAQSFVQRISIGDFQSLLRFDEALLAWHSRLPHMFSLHHLDTRAISAGITGTPSHLQHNWAEQSQAKRQATVLHARSVSWTE